MQNEMQNVLRVLFSFTIILFFEIMQCIGSEYPMLICSFANGKGDSVNRRKLRARGWEVDEAYKLIQDSYADLDANTFHLEFYDKKTMKYQYIAFGMDAKLPKGNNIMIAIYYNIIEHGHNKRNNDDNSSSSSHYPLLAIEGKAFTIINNEIPFMESSIVIHSAQGDITGKDAATGKVTWDASVALCKYLELNPSLVVDKNIIELGAGTGLTGIASAALGAKKTILTDLSYVIDNLNSNIMKNQHLLNKSSKVNNVVSSDSDCDNISCDNNNNVSISVKEVDWTNPSTYVQDEIFDVIILADCVWLEHLVPPLLLAIEALSGPKTELIIGHQHRSTACDDLLFNGIAKLNFNLQMIDRNDHHELYRSPKIDIYRTISL